jgi:hypothetical protein
MGSSPSEDAGSGWVSCAAKALRQQATTKQWRKRKDAYERSEKSTAEERINRLKMLWFLIDT